MRLSEFIMKLEEIQREHGDMAVVVWGYMGASRVDDLEKYIKVIEWTEKRKGQLEADRYKALCVHKESDAGRG